MPASNGSSRWLKRIEAVRQRAIGGGVEIFVDGRTVEAELIVREHGFLEGRGEHDLNPGMVQDPLDYAV